MADPLTPDEMAEELRRANLAEEARRVAAANLAAQGVPGYSAAPPAMSVAEPPPPAPIGPPPPPKPNPYAQGAKRALISAGGLMLGGPVGAIAANAYMNAEDVRPAAPKPEAPPELDPAGPPLPPATTEDAPLILDPRAQGGAAFQQISPAGMYPHSMSAQVHQGKPVPEETRKALAGSTSLALKGAEAQRNADQQYYTQVRDLQALRMRATEDAAAGHAAVQAQRDAIVKKKIAEIEAQNAEASAALDPNKYWTDRGAGAKVVGAIAVALGGFGDRLLGRENGALKIIEAGINRELQTQVQNRQLKGQQATHTKQILDLHLSRLGDLDKSIDASKLALWDNAALQLEAYKAQHGATMSEAAYNQLAAGILEKRGEVVNKMAVQEADDVNRVYTEQWRNAQYAGGAVGTPAGNMKGMELIPVPASDQTAEKGEMIAVPEGTHKELAAAVGFSNAIIGINNNALARIKEIKTDMDKAKGGDSSALARINANRKALNDLAQQKASFMSSAEAQGVLKEAEFQRAMETRTHFNDWWKPGVDVEKLIQAQNNAVMGASGRRIQGAGGQRVRMAYTRDKAGALQPTPLFKGQMYTPPPVGPEMGPVKEPGK